MRLQVRAARAADAAAAVPLIYSSGPDAFDFVFGTHRASARAFLLHAFADGAGEFGFRNHVVGEVGGRIVAAGTGFDAAATAGFTLAAARQIARHYGWRAGGPIMRGLRTEQVIRPPAPGEHYLAHLGVAPDARGHGYGTELVAWLIARGREHGCACATLDVAADNPRAETLYARLGFRVRRVTESRLRNAHGHVPTQRRMELALG